MTGLNTVSNNPRFGAIFVELEKKLNKKPEVTSIKVKNSGEFLNDTQVVIYNSSSDATLIQNRIKQALDATNLADSHTNTNNDAKTKQLKKLIRESVEALQVAPNIKKALRDFLNLGNKQLKSFYSKKFGEFTLHK